MSLTQVERPALCENAREHRESELRIAPQCDDNEADWELEIVHAGGLRDVEAGTVEVCDACAILVEGRARRQGRAVRKRVIPR